MHSCETAVNSIYRYSPEFSSFYKGCVGTTTAFGFKICESSLSMVTFLLAETFLADPEHAYESTEGMMVWNKPRDENAKVVIALNSHPLIA